MSAANVPLVLDQGEDWTTHIVWTDSFDEPLQVVAPCRMDVKSKSGQTQLSLSTPETPPPEGEIPEIDLSNDIGLIQLHVTKEVTQALQPGEYHYDLFVTVSDEDAYAGLQTIRLLYGTVTVNKRVTRMTT